MNSKNKKPLFTLKEVLLFVIIFSVIAILIIVILLKKDKENIFFEDIFKQEDGIGISSENIFRQKNEKDNIFDELNNDLFSCGQDFVDFRDGQIYPTVQIGEQCWISKNMNYDNGCTSKKWDVEEFIDTWEEENWTFNKEGYIEYLENNAMEKMAWCGCYKNKQENCDIYGKLYQLGAIKTICPPDWHLPSDAEWHILKDYLINNSVYFYDKCKSYTIGKALAATSSWQSFPKKCYVGNNIESNNISGFNALPGGAYWLFDEFKDLKKLAAFWSSLDIYSNSNPWIWYFSYDDENIQRDDVSLGSAFSIRCLQN